MKSLALALALSFSITRPLLALESSDASTIYDSNPNHLWNRLNQAIFQRTALDGKKFGLDELDILYWTSTGHLLTEPSHQQARTVLDEFINSHGERLISDPLKRALLQRDLWELFDWLVRRESWGKPKGASQEFEPRLVTVIRRLALNTNQIALLPDTYAQADARGIADLPRDLLNTNGDWVSVAANAYSGTIAPVHIGSFDGHSGFSVMLHVPGGRQAALDYLAGLHSFAQLDHTWVYESNRMSWRSTNEPKDVLELNPQIPQFPTNTEWAIVRSMCVIDTEGRIRPTPITESIQVRRYLEIKRVFDVAQDAQEFFEFEMDKRHHAALRAIGRDEKDFNFVHFQGQGRDLFGESLGPDWMRPIREPDSTKLQSAVLSTCFTCHNSRGIFSVLSYTGFDSFFVPLATKLPADMTPAPYTRQTDNAIGWKSGQYNWGLFQGLWRQVD